MKRLTGMGLMVLVAAFVAALFVDEALAARTLLTPLTVKGPYPGTVSAGDLSVTALDAVDNTNGNYWLGNGRDLMVIENPTAGAITVTLTSIADQFGRKGDITAYSIPANTGHMFFWFGSLIGWAQDAQGSIYLDASATGLKVKILRLP